MADTTTSNSSTPSNTTPSANAPATGPASAAPAVTTEQAAKIENDNKSPLTAGGQAEVQEKVDKENEAGVRGGKGALVDPTPNEHYTFMGAAKGLPTPETDKAQAQIAGGYGVNRFVHLTDDGTQTELLTKDEQASEAEKAAKK